MLCIVLYCFIYEKFICFLLNITLVYSFAVSGGIESGKIREMQIVIIINLFIVDHKNTIKNIFISTNVALKYMANLGQLLTKKIKIT